MDISQFVGQILQGSIPKPERGIYQPTLVVGLGGTGVKVLRILKGYLAQHEINWVKLLGIDSDQTENISYPRLLRLSDSEMALLDANAAVRLLARAAARQPGTDHVLQYLPDEYDNHTGVHQEVIGRIQIQRGAGQFRRAGKLLFCSNVSNGCNLEAVVRRLREEMVGLPATVDRLARGVEIQAGSRVFVVSSLAGGQGSGALLDCLALLRKHFDRPMDQIIAILVLPGELYDRQLHNPAAERPQTRGNAIGALRELQAFLQGQLGDYTFVFDADNRFTPGATPLLNCAYLVDHATISSRCVGTDFELFEAVSLFLYALIGCGVGAKQETGDINGPAEHVNDPLVPRVYKGFGIGVLQYPVQDLLEFCLWQSLKQWLDQWLQGTTDDTARNEASSFLTRLGIDNLDRHREKIRPEIAEASFFEGEQEEILVRMPDEEFFRRVNVHRAKFDSDLSRYEPAIDRLRTRLEGEVRNELREQTLAWAATGGGLARDCLAQLKQQLMEHRDQHLQEARMRPEALTKSDQEMAELAKKITRLPGPLDRSSAREYRRKFNDWLKEKVNSKLDEYLSMSLTQTVNCVETLAAEVENLLRTFNDIRVQAETALNRLTAPPASSSFIQLALTGPEFPDWCCSHFVGVPTPLPRLSSLDAFHVLTTALAPVIEGYHRHLQGLNVIEALRESDDLRNRLAAVETAAEPLISLTNVAPPLQDMSPLKFVIGRFDGEGAEGELARYFTPIGSGEVRSIGTKDPFRLLCVQSVHGFGAAHWIGFEWAESCYRADEWRCHVLPDYEALEPLRRTGEERSKALRCLGLCMAFQFIHVRGANYYRNLVWKDKPVEKYSFEFYNGQPNAGARTLLDKQLILMPSPAAFRPTRKDPRLLGESLQDALRRLTSPQYMGFVSDVTELCEDLMATIGRPNFAQILLNFVHGELNQLRQVRTQDSSRQEILREMSEVLQQYAAELT